MLNGTRIIPTWAVAVLRLQTLEHELKLDEMGITRDLDEPATKDHRREPAANADAYVINANAPAFHERNKTRNQRVLFWQRRSFTHPAKNVHPTSVRSNTDKHPKTYFRTSLRPASIRTTR